MIHVCSLAHLSGTVEATKASHVITVMADVHKVQRPRSIHENNHLVISMDDITAEAQGFVAPNRDHVERGASVSPRGWDRSAALVVHCYAGISPLTAAALSPPPVSSIPIAAKPLSRGRSAPHPQAPIRTA